MTSRPSRTKRRSAATPLLLVAVGLALIGFGGQRLQTGTIGLPESITLVACVVAGTCFLVSALLGLRKPSGRPRK